MTDAQKIAVYAPNLREAGRLAADMNLALRHWYWAGESAFFRLGTWADVGMVMDEYQELYYMYAQVKEAVRELGEK